jgi:hypothetical protein
MLKLLQHLSFPITLMGYSSIPPAKDFLFAGSAETNRFLVDLFHVGGGLHHALQGEAVNQAKGVS